MRVLFLTISRLVDITERNIYNDLMRKFRDEGHEVYIVSPRERRYNEKTALTTNNGIHILGVKTLNLIKTNIIEKGLGQVLMQRQFVKAIDKHLNNVCFDLVLYSTPPITLNGVVKHLKKRQPSIVSYLMLKDIFPQNAVDMGMLAASSKPSPQGKGFKNAVIALPKYLLYKYFRKKEVALYKTSDFIGCMSPANVEFVLKHNPEIEPSRVEVAPNSVELLPELSPSDERNKRLIERNYIRSKYHLPIDKPVFIYGGNLGKPQGIPFLIGCLDANANRDDSYFVVVGNGTERPKLKAWYEEKRPKSVTVMDGLPKTDYDMLVRSCDVGLIFLDHRFTIPNYPSRLLSYLENKMPVICATDPNTDIGRIAEENGYGFWCESVKPEDFTALVDKMLASDRKTMGEKGYEFLKNNYTVENCYQTIIKHIKS